MYKLKYTTIEKATMIKKELGKLIRNLVRVIGSKELIRRTGGSHKTIEFIPQTLPEAD